jgi:hypothetical protein
MWLLTFAQNRFTGTISSSFSNLTSLQGLDLSSSVNMLSRYLRPTLGRLPALQGLVRQHVGQRQNAAAGIHHFAVKL